MSFQDERRKNTATRELSISPGPSVWYRGARMGDRQVVFGIISGRRSKADVLFLVRGKRGFGGTAKW